MGLLSLEVVSGGTGGGDKVREREREPEGAAKL